MQLHLAEHDGLQTYINQILMKSYKIKIKMKLTQFWTFHPLILIL